MSEPISLDVLVHSATLYAENGEDGYANPAWSSTAVNLSRVFVSTVRRTLLTSLGESRNDALTLIFDCTNSLPVGTTFKARDKIVYGTGTYYIREVSNPSGDTSSPHHYRCALVGV